MRPLDFLEKRLSVNEGWIPSDDLLERAVGDSLSEVVEFLAFRRATLVATGRDLLEQLRNERPQALEYLLEVNDLAVLDANASRGRAESVHRFQRGYLLELDCQDERTELINQSNQLLRDDLRQAGVAKGAAFAIAAACDEMVSNAVQHAFSTVAPVACFQVRQSKWEFGVTDLGIGVLDSLRTSPSLGHLTRGDQALRLALKDGVSRTDERGRGRGFTHVFKAMVDRQAQVRIRTADVIASWKGISITRQTVVMALGPPRLGFHVAVTGGI